MVLCWSEYHVPMVSDDAKLVDVCCTSIGGPFDIMGLLGGPIAVSATISRDL